jgi:hypothetical protein
MSRVAIVALLSACAISPTVETDEPDDLEERACPAIRGLAAGCGDLLEEPVYVTLIDKGSGRPHDIALVGETSGNTCALASFRAANVIEYVTSLAVINTDVFYCAATEHGGAGQLTRVSMIDGSVSLAAQSCLSVTSFEDHLYLMTDVGSPLQQYASWDAVKANAPTPTPIGECGIRLGASENKLYSTWPTTSAVYTFDPASQTSTKLAMASQINVHGMASQRGTLAILDGYSYDQFLYTFDATTGAPQGKVGASTQVLRLHGLSNACQIAAVE